MMTCPKHGTAKIRSGKSQRPPFGDYHWCSTQVGIGQPDSNAKGYCSIKPVDMPEAGTYQPPPSPVSSPAPIAAPVASQAVPDSNVSRGTLACAALAAAARSSLPQHEVILLADYYLHGFLLRAANSLPPDTEGLPF